jgi:hypothetical protein
VYCPSCKIEFGNEISTCATCNGPLILQALGKIGPQDTLVELLKTQDVAYLMVVKSVLQASGIAFLVQGEEGLHMLPLSLSGGFFNTSAYGAVVRVRAGDLLDAQRLLEETAEFPEDTAE